MISCVLEKDLSSQNLELWNLNVFLNETFISSFDGLRMPENVTVKARHWTYDDVIPELTDPFNPLQTNSVIRGLNVPLPKSQACHYGRAFADVESSVQSVYVGVTCSKHVS